MTEVSAASACVSTVDVPRCMRAVRSCSPNEGFACNAKRSAEARVAHITYRIMSRCDRIGSEFVGNRTLSAYTSSTTLGIMGNPRNPITPMKCYTTSHNITSLVN
jgi:hypothetical protein